MNKFIAMLCCLFFTILSFGQKTNDVLQAEQQFLKTISPKVVQLKPDASVKTTQAALSAITADCVDVMYFKNDPADSAFFEFTTTKVSYRSSYAPYAVTLNGVTQNIAIKILLVQFPKGVAMQKAAALLAPCYCLPQVYVIPFYTNNGLFVSVQPQLTDLQTIAERNALYNALKDYFIKTLTPKYVYQNVSLMTND